VKKKQGPKWRTGGEKTGPADKKANASRCREKAKELYGNQLIEWNDGKKKWGQVPEHKASDKLTVWQKKKK